VVKGIDRSSMSSLDVEAAASRLSATSMGMRKAEPKFEHLQDHLTENGKENERLRLRLG
jgi:hypothetical protein